MPPKGVQVLARATNQVQAEWLAGELAKASPVPVARLEDWLGEEPQVIRVRKTPTYWNVESWSRSAIEAAQRDADDLPFDRSEAAVAFP